MASFRGKYDYQLDAKGRVSIPAKFRKALTPEAEDTFIIVCAPGGSLRAYPKDVWETYESRLAALPETPKNNWIKTVMFAIQIESTLDVQGRVLLSPELMKRAGITKEVVLVGMLSYVGLWDKAKYDEYLASDGNTTDSKFDEVFYEVMAGLAGQ